LFESLLKQVNVNHKIDRNLEIGKAKSWKRNVVTINSNLLKPRRDIT
jgi:hypothetical protein